jgi:hypothetical protein
MDIDQETYRRFLLDLSSLTTNAIDRILNARPAISVGEFQTRIQWNTQKFSEIDDDINIVRSEIFGNGNGSGLKSKVNNLCEIEKTRGRVQSLLLTGFILNLFSLICGIILHFMTK